MKADTLEVYEIFKKSLSEPEARKVIAYFEEAKDKEITATVERKIEHLATKEDLANAKAELIKWLFIFLIGQTSVIAGIVFAVLKMK